VQDFGSGFVATAPSSESGLGLVSMRERLRMVQGAFRVSSEPGHGTLAEARVPLALDLHSATAPSEIAEVTSP
jgi:signal transduction histidine kinase